MSVFIHNTIFVIQNGVKRNEESNELPRGRAIEVSKGFQTFHFYPDAERRGIL